MTNCPTCPALAAKGPNTAPPSITARFPAFLNEISADCTIVELYSNVHWTLNGVPPCSGTPPAGATIWNGPQTARRRLSRPSDMQVPHRIGSRSADSFRCVRISTGVQLSIERSRAAAAETCADAAEVPVDSG